MNTQGKDSFIYQKLRQVGLSELYARKVSVVAKVRSFSINEVIWSKGSDINSWLFIIEGLVAASIPTSNSKATPISIYGQDSWFGEQEIINRKPSYAEYSCLVPTEVLCLDAPTVLMLFEAEPGFSRFIARLLSWRVHKTSEMLMLMKLGNSCLRVVMGLSQFAEALTYSSSRPPTIGFGQSMQVPINQSVLASLCGVSRTVFSEQIHHLSLNGWIRISYGKLELLSIDSWHNFSRKQRQRNFNNLDPTIEEILTELNNCNTF